MEERAREPFGSRNHEHALWTPPLVKPVATVLALLVAISILLSARRARGGSECRLSPARGCASVSVFDLPALARLVQVCGDHPVKSPDDPIARQRQPKRSPADGQRDDRQNN